ncbi:ABC transporter permease [Massilia sp. TWP1-3-3]|uniref:ABC transporter permease n=1 Tax=Massilia sp. TWP1-3-3 TaxID=2804573 RepID=UPI003CF76DE7
MTLHDFKIGWRLLLAEPVYSAVVSAGLAVGFAVCFLLLAYVRYCYSYDSAVPDAAQVHIMQHRINLFPTPVWREPMPLPAAASALRSGMTSQVSVAVPLDVVFDALFDNSAKGARRQRGEAILVDASFPAMFGVAALEGDLAAALARPDAVALTVAQAQAVLGSAAGVVGKVIRINGLPYRVLALLPDPPSNTTLPYRTLAGTASALWPQKKRDAMLHAWTGTGGKIYVRLRAGSSAADLQGFLQGEFDRSAWTSMVGQDELKRMGHVAEVRLRPVRESYFDAGMAQGRLDGPHGERRIVLALGAVALLILALASANYINLATVRTLRRDREIGMRKMLGAGAWRLTGLFLAESVVVALLSGALGLLLAWLLLPLFSALVDRDLGGALGLGACAGALALALGIGLASGAYPACIALRLRPVDALAGRGNAENRRGLWLRRSLSVLQFGAAIALSSSAVAIAWQASFAAAMDPGFDPLPLHVARLPDDATAPQRLAMREALARLSGVEGVAATSSPIGATGVMKWAGAIKVGAGREVPMRFQPVSTGFFKVFGVKPLHGRVFDPAIDQPSEPGTGNVVISLAAVRALGFASAQEALGQGLDGGKMRIIGVVPEVRDQTLRDAAEPMIYPMSLPDAEQALTIRSRLSSAALAALIEPLWRRQFPNELFALRRAASYFEEGYADDVRLAKLLGAASVVALLIAAFGIYVLAAYSVQRRAREIVLRKLHGASRSAIARLLGKQYAALIGAGALLGLPLAAVVMQRYLAGFVERAPMGWWPLAGALAFAALVALAATTRHTLAAMRIAPALALRA